MENEILDDGLIVDNVQKDREVLLHWTSIIILWIGIGMSVAFGFISEPKFIAGAVVLLIVSLINYKQMEIGVKITLGIIVAGIFNLIDFFPFDFEFILEFFEFTLTFDLILFLLFFIHYLTNKKFLAKYVGPIFDPENMVENPNENRSQIAGFKRRFKHKSVAELSTIVTNEKLVAEARLAAQELIAEIEDSNEG